MKKTLFVLIIFIISVQIGSAQENLSIEQTAHGDSACSGSFVTHELEHMTSVNEMPIRMFESNGAGLAINDLNNDGQLDIVLANLDGEESILWNEGNLQFRRSALNIPGKTRSVAILDLDADGWQDIIFTTQRAAPSFWRNQGDETFELEGLIGVTHPAYAMNWADLDHDGDLDLVTGSYDAEMERIDASYLLDGGSGIYYYENEAGQFNSTRLAERSQALAIYFPDLNGDGLWDIAVGNDFAELDRYWLHSDGSWEESYPFGVITHSTMSFAAADIENNGTMELYATDMHPYSDDEETNAAWQPVMDDMMAMPMPEDDPQVMVNVLQTIEDSDFSNVSESLGIQYTGWSWSAKFGDLNSDGFPDLYVVNGMIAEDLFGHLPNNELVEENQVFMNSNGTSFATMPEWGLAATQSGRGMSMADLDGDGDLDIVVNNLMSSAMLYENQLCGGDNLTLSLYDAQSDNVAAIGSYALLHTSEGVYRRDVTASSGYLSGDPSQLHFGFTADSDLLYLEVFWLDGTVSRIDQIDRNTNLTITHNSSD